MEYHSTIYGQKYPSNLVQPVKINSKYYKTNKNQTCFENNLVDINLKTSAKNEMAFYQKTRYNAYDDERYEDSNYIKNLVPKARILSDLR